MVVSVGVILLFSCISTMAILFTLSKFGLKRMLWLDWLWDISAFVAVKVLFFGTFAGMVTAMFTGLMLSVVLWALKHHVVGYSKPIRTRWGITWVDVPPSSSRFARAQAACP